MPRGLPKGARAMATKKRRPTPKRSSSTSSATRSTKSTPRASGARRPARTRTSPRPDLSWGADISLPSWIEPVILVVVVGFVLWQLAPTALFSSSLPTGSDLGGHVAGPIQLGHLLPALTGWSNQQFGGLALYQFYMPVPALLIVLVNVVLPYGTAVKIVVALAVLGVPIAAWALGRLSRLPGPMPAVMAIAVLPFLFDSSYFKYGGNLLSTVAGEYSYGLGFVLSLVFLGVLDVALRTGRWRALSAVLGALAALCHPAVGLMAALAAVLLIGAYCLGDAPTALRRALPVVVLAPLMSAFWYLPFIAHRGETDPLPYPLTGGYLQELFPLPIWASIVMVPLAVYGAYRAIERRHPVGMMLAGLAVCTALAVLVLPRGWIGGWEFQQTLTELAGRMQPYWYVSLGLLCGIGGGDLIRRASQWSLATVVLPLGSLVVTLVAVAVGSSTFSGSSASPTSISGSVHHAFAGYQGTPTWPEYHALMTTMTAVGEKHGCGRALPEFDASARYGSPFELTLLPYWTGGCIQAMYGAPDFQSLNYTFQDQVSAAVSPVNFSTQQPGVAYPNTPFYRAVPLLRSLGIRYYLASDAEVIALADKQVGLRRVATSGPWVIYQVLDSNLVEGLARTPVVAFPSTKVDALAWLDTATPWFLGHAAARPSAGGPTSWPRTQAPKVARPGPVLPPVKVSAVTLTQNSVAFHVDRIGVPVEVKETYFPWWHAVGAEGPWRIAPDFLVVVPTSHSVVLTASPGAAEHVGTAVSLIAVGGTIVLALWDRRRRTSGEIPLGSEPTGADED